MPEGDIQMGIKGHSHFNPHSCLHDDHEHAVKLLYLSSACVRACVSVHALTHNPQPPALSRVYTSVHPASQAATKEVRETRSSLLDSVPFNGKKPLLHLSQKLL